MKNCNYCGVEFIPNSSKQVCCSKLCNVNKWRRDNPEKAKAAQQKNEQKRKGVKRYNSEVRKIWYKNKKQDSLWHDKIKSQARERRKMLTSFLNNLKIKTGCKDCGYNAHHVALDFDHITDNKTLNVSNAKSIKQALKEIEKCEVVCSNCHRIRTYQRLNSKPDIFELTYDIVK
jgi:hypothetical protein